MFDWVDKFRQDEQKQYNYYATKITGHENTMGIFNNLLLMFLSLKGVDNFKRCSINKYGWRLIGLLSIVLIIYSINIFRSGGSGISQEYVFVLVSFTIILAILFTFSRLVGSLAILLGFLMITSSLGMIISNIIMGYDYSWGQDIFYHHLSSYLSSGLDVKPEGQEIVKRGNVTTIQMVTHNDVMVMTRYIFMVSFLIGGYLVAYLGLRLSLHVETENAFVNTKNRIAARRDAIEEEQRQNHQNEMEAQQAQKRQNKGGYSACPNCGATNWEGKRLAIAECNICKTYFCKTCSGNKFMGRVQKCPKCGSDSFKQKGFVEA